MDGKVKMHFVMRFFFSVISFTSNPGTRFTKNITMKIIVSLYHELLTKLLKFIAELKSLHIQKICINRFTLYKQNLGLFGQLFQKLLTISPFHLR